MLKEVGGNSGTRFYVSTTNQWYRLTTYTDAGELLGFTLHHNDRILEYRDQQYQYLSAEEMGKIGRRWMDYQSQRMRSFPKEEWIQLFESVSTKIDAEVRRYVLEKMRQAPEGNET